LEFLFGEVVDPGAYDLGDADVRARLLERSFDRSVPAAQLAPFEILANRIFADDPPEVWATAQRLLAEGFDRDMVFVQLALALARALRRDAPKGEERFDEAIFLESLSRLPAPWASEIEETMAGLVRAHQGIGADELLTRTLAELGRDPGDKLAEEMVDHRMDALCDRSGPLAMLSPDRMVHVEGITEGIVLTHRLQEEECDSGSLDTSFDLSGFCRREALRLPSGEPVEAYIDDPGPPVWTGPAGWLAPFPAGSVVCVRVDGGGVVRIEPLAAEPPVDPALVARLRAAYDTEVAEPWLPVEGEELVLALLLEDGHTFHEPTATLGALAGAAGLERRLDRVAHDPSVWHSDDRMRRMHRVLEALGFDFEASKAALRVLDVADRVAGIDTSEEPETDGPPDRETLRTALEELCDPFVFSAVAGELFDSGEEAAPTRAEAFVDALVGAANRPSHVAAARLLASILAERASEPQVAEQQLALAVQADPDCLPAIDRLAWYASLRGDAPRAVALWHQLRPTDVIAQDLATIEPFASAPRAALGRNTPCWCGSGRRYKQCHLGAPDLPPLPERVGWLCRKAVGFLERYGPSAHDDVMEVARARAADPDDDGSLADAFDDPIVMDLALTEGGWFDRFLEERGALLPADEALLAQSWALVPRTLYEVLETRPGRGLTLVDLRTGDRVDVAERTFSAEARAGQVVCGRAVHDGETHRLIGGLFGVPPGREARLLDLLDEGDPVAIAAWVAALSRPPVLYTREGEPMVECELVVDVADEDATRAFLDATYEVEDESRTGSWVEMFPLNQDEKILRARLRLAGTRLRVSTTSEARADRVLATLGTAHLGARVVSDRRRPMDMASVIRRAELERALAPEGGGLIPGPAEGSPEVAAFLEEMRNRFEERWCDEPVPALGGITPRQAADDPSRREALVRLIDSFEHAGGPPEAITMRPDRLRELLGL
jgi:hypothetical protein